MFWLNMILCLSVMYVVMFTMIDGLGDFMNNLNMFYMAVTMWAPMGIFMLETMPGMFPKWRVNFTLYILFAILPATSRWATRAQAVIDDRQFIASKIPHQPRAILMCREAILCHPGLLHLCGEITQAQREEIDQMERIAARLR
jgi:hypothetical protein|nr:DUF305 domain-containing protein [Mesorhizobium sp.]